MIHHVQDSAIRIISREMNTEKCEDNLALAICLASRLLSMGDQPLALKEMAQSIPFRHLTEERSGQRAIRGSSPVSKRHRARLIVVAGLLYGFANPIYRPLFPSVPDVSLHSLTDFPLPLTSMDSAHLDTFHLAEMCSPEYLEDGPWTGIWTTDPHQHLTVERPMPAFYFRVRRHSSAQPDVVEIRAVLKDRLGFGKIEGSVDRRSGKVPLSMAPAEEGTWSSDWHWSCLMTPFGIVGSYGDDLLGGWVWLWKVRKGGASS